MNPVQGYHLITPGDLTWRLSNLMRIPNADFLERTGSENMGARLWRMPPMSANTLHKHIRAEEFYFVLEGTGRLRVGDETLTVPKHGGVTSGRINCGRCSTTPPKKCSGSSSAHRRKPSFSPVPRPSPTCPSFIRPIPRNCRRNSQASTGRQKAEHVATFTRTWLLAAPCHNRN